jgi:hypothetical protein
MRTPLLHKSNNIGEKHLCDTKANVRKKGTASILADASNYHKPANLESSKALALATRPCRTATDCLALPQSGCRGLDAAHECELQSPVPGARCSGINKRLRITNCKIWHTPCMSTASEYEVSSGGPGPVLLPCSLRDNFAGSNDKIGKSAFKKQIKIAAILPYGEMVPYP